MKQVEGWKAKEKLEAILRQWTYRAIGNTHAMLHGMTSDALIVCRDIQHERDLLGHGVYKKQLIQLSRLPEALMGTNKPLLVDHSIMCDLIYKALSEAEQAGMEKQKEIDAWIVENEGSYIGVNQPRAINPINEQLAKKIREAKG